MKIGIIRCDEHSDVCAGSHCFPSIYEKTGEFEGYDVIQLVGFDTCGGCGRGKTEKIVARASRLKEMGAEVIHLGNCLTGPCPSAEEYEKALQEEVGIKVVKGTHPAPSRK